MSQRPGHLVVIGGAEDKKGECKILREFVRLSGGPRARIVVMTVATELPLEVGAEYMEVFDRIGVEDVRTFDVSNRANANAESAVKAIEKATGVFFTGGDQVRITNLLGGTKIDAILHKRHEEGMVLGGTSAGASMMSNIMIIEGEPETNPRLGAVEMGAGMEFIPGVVIDQHFAQRGRIGRLLSAVAKYPHHLGIGIDENTALLLKDHVFEVIGDGAVTVLDAGAMTYSNAPGLHNNDNLAMCGIVIHVLPAGYRFHLRERTPVIETGNQADRTRS
ncbi:cyanophycinase [Effusibacillus lacus]|uniref:Cyanophycinase n=1 Tax=Effusibacillus lacus TaxID=1348429 RepID=A0A292YJK6_9BACL|nr:cyanophycinase [Effusibacillus lacus]TCS74451.1 cyanophycinase [Effusibacillus lacus]GAX88675.1 cyanophycinase [Effusibacillus lacus]